MRDPESMAEDSASSTSSSSSDSERGYRVIDDMEDIIEEDVRRPRLHTLNCFGKGDHQSLTKEGRDAEQGVTTSQKVNEWWYEKTSLLSRVSPIPFLISINSLWYSLLAAWAPTSL